MIKDAAKTYFTSTYGTERLKNSGKYDSKCVLQRRRNRVMRKLNARRASLHKTASVGEKDKAKFLECLVPELMSSEDSEDDGSFTVHPLPWRSEKATSLILTLDNKHKKIQEQNHDIRRKKWDSFGST